MDARFISDVPVSGYKEDSFGFSYVYATDLGYGVYIFGDGHSVTALMLDTGNGIPLRSHFLVAMQAKEPWREAMFNQPNPNALPVFSFDSEEGFGYFADDLADNYEGIITQQDKDSLKTLFETHLKGVL